jgi:hypothetical protein
MCENHNSFLTLCNPSKINGHTFCWLPISSFKITDMSQKQPIQPNTNPKSMINQKTYEDFNKEKPDAKGEFFTDGNKTADGVNLGNTDQKITEVKNYTCSMHPDVKSDTPDKCPICGMSLIEQI